jgi:hypothetical protein
MQENKKMIYVFYATQKDSRRGSVININHRYITLLVTHLDFKKRLKYIDLSRLLEYLRALEHLI